MFSRILKELDAAIKIRDKLKNLKKSSHVIEEKSVSSRFFELFESHGVHRNQIPRFFGHDLSTSDVQNGSTLLPKLTEEILNDVCDLFAIRREWLDGAENKIHPEYDFYKKPENFLEFIEKLKSENPEGDLSGVLIKPENDKGYPYSLIILQEKIGSVGDKPIYRFYLCNNWSYSYWKSRAYLTACVAIAWKRKVYIHGITLPRSTIDQIADGENLLGWNGEGLWGLGHKTWHPDDMADRPAVFLEGLDPEENKFGIKSALRLWLKLDEKGFMDSGFGETPRQAFEKELEKYS